MQGAKERISKFEDKLIKKLPNLKKTENCIIKAINYVTYGLTRKKKKTPNIYIRVSDRKEKELKT